MNIRTTAPTLYIPRWRGNQELPDSEQIKARVKFPTTAEFEPFAGTTANDLDVPGIVRSFVVGIAGLTIDGEPIESGKHLVDQAKRAVVRDLVNELAMHILTGCRIEEPDEKNSEPPSN